MKTQKNTTAFQIVAVVGLLFHGLLLDMFKGGPILGLPGSLLALVGILVGTVLLAAGILLAKSKFMAIGVLINIGSEILRVIIGLLYIRHWLPEFGNLYIAWHWVCPIMTWILIAIALIKRDKAMPLCCIAAVVSSGVSLLLDDIPAVYRITYVLIYFTIALLGYVLQNGMQSVFASRPVETPKTASNQFENLIKLKDLLDSGAITQEEFDQKKKELLEV